MPLDLTKAAQGRWLIAVLLASLVFVFTAVCLWGHVSREEAVPANLKSVPQYGE